LSHQDLLTEVHTEYLRSGADIVTANTFATTRFVLAGTGLERRFSDINAAAIDAARRAVTTSNRNSALAASLSCLPPGFDTRAYPDPAAECRAYAELAELFAASAVDLVLLEMLQDTVHAPRACRAVRASGLPFWIGISCRRDAETGRLVGFDDSRSAFDAVVDALLPFGPAGVAIMHSPLDAVSPALAALGERWTGPLGAYAEIPYAADPKSKLAPPSVGPETYAAAAREWIALGAVLVGGCCGTTPAHIEALRELVDGS
jgi:methionine synthase I (cobalamin-dependent)